jgi:PKD repeat protein
MLRLSRILVGVGVTVFLLAQGQTVSAQTALQAILRTDPEADAVSGEIHLPASGGSIRLLPGDSLGDIVSYAIDINAAVDTSGDGDPDNDGDNALHPSFQTGEAWTVNLRALPGERERWLKLTVVDASGMTDSVEHKILFDTVSPPPQGELTLTSDQPILRMGEQFTLRLQNIPAGVSVFSWDLQSDGKEDTQTSVPSLLLEPDAPGVLPVRVTLLNAGGIGVATVSREFHVGPLDGMGQNETPPEEEAGITLRIDAEAEELKVVFHPELTSPLNLLELYPTWTFGDGGRSFLLEPTYSYATAGTYDVTLTLQDPVTQDEVASARATVTVTGAPAPEPSEEGSGFLDSIGSLFSGIFAAVLFIAGIFVLLFLLIFAFLFIQARMKKRSVSDTLADWKKTFFRGVDEQPALSKTELPKVTPPSLKKLGEEKPLEMVVPPPKPSTSLDSLPTGQAGARDLRPSKPSTPPTPPKSAPPPPAPKPPAAPIVTEDAVLPPWLRPKSAPPPPPPKPSPSVPSAPSTPPSSSKPPTLPPPKPVTPPPPPSLDSLPVRQAGARDLRPPTPPPSAPLPPWLEKPKPTLPPQPPEPKELKAPPVAPTLPPAPKPPSLPSTPSTPPPPPTPPASDDLEPLAFIKAEDVPGIGEQKKENPPDEKKS